VWLYTTVMSTSELSVDIYVVHFYILGHISLQDEFYSRNLKEYFLYWYPLMSIEMLSEVSAIEQSLEQCESYFEVKPFVDEYTVNDVVCRKVILNVHGSEQPFKPENGLTLSWNKDMKRQPLFFAEMTEMTGMC